MGVTKILNKKGKIRYRARAYENGKQISLGHFTTYSAAKQAYNSHESVFARKLDEITTVPKKALESIEMPLKDRGVVFQHTPPQKRGFFARIFNR